MITAMLGALLIVAMAGWTVFREYVGELTWITYAIGQAVIVWRYMPRVKGWK